MKEENNWVKQNNLINMLNIRRDKLIIEAFSGNIEAQRRINLKVLRDGTRKFGSWIIGTTLHIKEF